MSFPSSPTAGQTAVVNNIIYSYSTSTQAWTRVAGQVTATTYLSIINNTPTNSTITGALQVVGGVGIGGGLFVGGVITATSFVGTFIGSGAITTATNLLGGTAGQLHYQTGPGATGFAGPGTAGQVLVSAGTSAPVYTNTASIYVNDAVVATNIRAGTAGQLVYNSAASTTGFVGPGTAGQILVSNGASAPVYTNTGSIYVYRATIADSATGGAGSTTGALTAGTGLTSSGGAFNGSTNLTFSLNTATLMATAVTANNVAGGTAGQLVYQTGVGATSFAGPGTAGQLLMSAGTSAPTYTNTASIYVNDAVVATNLRAGTAGQIPYQTGAGATSFFGAGTAGQILVSAGAAAPVYTSTSSIYVNRAVLADSASGSAGSVANALTIGTGLSGTSYNGSSAVTIANTGVLTITGTANQVLVNGGTASANGNITLTLPQSINSGAAPTFAGTNFTSIPNGALTNSAVTVTAGTGLSGGGSVALGASTTLSLNTATLVATAVNVNGVVAVANGGTGLSSAPANGVLDIGNGTGFTRTTLTAGTAIGVSNASGSITITNTGVTSNVAGTGISVSAATGAVTITNSGVTSIVAGTAISVSGATGAVTVNNTGVTSAAVSGTGLSINASTGGITITSNATNLNTVSTIVARDASGNFSAGTITAALTGNVTGNVTGSSGSTTGNAATATALQTARLIQGVSFNGSADITVVTAGTGIGVSGTTVTNNGVTSNVAGTGVSVSGATGAVTISIGQAVATSSNVQFNSLGVGTAGSATAGEIRATNEITAYYSSDARLKVNVVKIDNPMEKLNQIRGVYFDWTDETIKVRGGEDGYFVRKHDIGVIAQEVEAVLPEIVATRDDGFKAVKYEKLVPLLIEAIKTLEERIRILEGKSGS